MEQMDVQGMGDRKINYPKGIFFIMATELSERFSYYGMRAVLTIYMRNILTFTENQATSYYHIFLMLCYGLPIFWGVISDSFIGKFKTILYVSILFAIGNITLALSSVPPLQLPTEAFFFIGLFLMAVGTSGMKPCVAPLGGEQFVLPEQSKQLAQFFWVFFFVVTIGNMLSTVITPIFRRDVSCFGMDNCYPLAFGVPAMSMIFAVLIFLRGKPLYKVTKPNGNMLVKVTKCIAHALSNRWKGKDLSSHWLDSASDSFDQETIDDTKGLLRILPYFVPVPIFFALYEQLGSRWTLQATKMKGTLGQFSIKPDQMQVFNAILMLISLPFFNWVVYPVLTKCRIKPGTLGRMVIGGIFAAASFGAAGIVQMKIEPSIKTQPAKAHTVLTLVNSMRCPVTVWANSTTSTTFNYTVEASSSLALSPIKFKTPILFIVRTVDGKCPKKLEWIGEKSLLPGEYQSLTILELCGDPEKLDVTAYPFVDDYKKSKDGNARIRFIIERDNYTKSHFKSDLENLKITVTTVNGGLSKTFELWQMGNIFYSETEEIDENEYSLSLQSSKSNFNLDKKFQLLNGGSYNLIVNTNEQHNVTQLNLVTITPPNDVHILWLLPQYVLMAWGEILFIVSGMEFAYTEAPASMRSVVQAIWHLMNACGNLIVIISAQYQGQGSQALEFFLFGGCMCVDAIIFGFMARRYKYVALDHKVVVMH